MTQPPTYDSYTHPLLQLRSQVTRQGQVDESGLRHEVNTAGCVMPVQQIYRRLNIQPEQLADFCEKWEIAELALFGSVLRADFRASGENCSDVDWLFSYLPGANMSLFRRATMKRELEDLIGRKVDLIMVAEVIESRNPIRRKNILDSAQIIYVKG